jgi:hypothetical protein
VDCSVLPTCENIGDTVRHESAAVRVRRRITEWVNAQGHGSRKRLADAVRGLYGHARSGAWVTDIVDGKQDLRLRDLDGVAEALGVPPGDLVRRDDNFYLEVTHTERRLIGFYRSLPDVARHHLLEYFNYIYGLQQKVMETQARERDARTAEAKRLHASAQHHTRKRPPA